MTRTLQREPRPPAASQHRRRRPDAHSRNLLLLWAGQFVNTAGLMMLVPIMPFYLEDMGTRGTTETQTWAGVAIAAPALALTVATPLWGRLGDRVGRKWMVVRALFGLVAAMVVMAAATTPVLLVVGRLLQGSLGGVVEAAAAFAGSAGADKKRGSSLGKSFSATAAGALAGPIAGGLFVGAGGLRQLMLVIAAAAAVIAVACAIGLEEPERGRPRNKASDTRHRTRERRSSALHVPSALVLALAAIGAYFGSYGLIPVFAEQVKDVVAEPDTASLWAGVLHSVMWGATLVGSFWWGKHNDRTNRPLRTFAIAAAGISASIAVLSLPLGPIAYIPLRLVQGFCFAALAQSLFLHFSHHAPDDHKSSYVGTANSFLLIGQSAGPLLAGSLVAVMPVSSAVLTMAAASGLGCLLALVATRREKRTLESSDEADEDETIVLPTISTSDAHAKVSSTPARTREPARVQLQPFRGWLLAPHRLQDLGSRYATPWDHYAGSCAPAEAGNALRAWQRSGTLVQDRQHAFYVYEQTGPRGSQRGVIAGVHLDSHLLPHQEVSPDRANNLLDTVRAGQMNLDPVLLGYTGNSRVTTQLNAAARQSPVSETLTAEGQRHRLWRITESEALNDIARELATASTFIADGHHRHVAARQYRRELHSAAYGPGPWDYLTGYFVDLEQNPLHLAPIHRVLPGVDAHAALNQAATRYRILPLGGELAGWLRTLKQYTLHGPAFVIVSPQGAFLLSAPDRAFLACELQHLPEPLHTMDVAVLHTGLIQALWRVREGHIHYEANAATAVQQVRQRGGLAVLLAPPRQEEVKRALAAGVRIPRKALAFGPKPHPGLVLRTFDED
ncbi:MFS transporter [Allosaccharopolyspora coralli]|uniref:MFS transporter n=1 Tax=Allosaccharopolyspora coralli TaxID=2665642 RepID=A0A5Q3QFH2_9PSEU|nr:MFS transporter [Allosaccharopolyspora coralli]QGK70209.1 MFS transporter [Allosaccharopolyspora coralli]